MILKSKKGLYQGLPLEIISVIVMVLTVSVALYSGSVFSKSVENSAPQISYEYPKVLINTFLMQPVSKEDSKEIFNDESDYLIRDLIWYGTDESLNVVKDYSLIYMDDIDSIPGENSLELYHKFSRNLVNNIDIEKQSDSLLGKNDILEDYSYIFLTKDEEYVKISFGGN